MKNILHRINIFLCILLIASGVAILINAGDFMGDAMIIYIVGGFQIIMALVVLIIGALMPKDDQVLSKKSRFFLRILLMVAALSGETGVSSSAVNVTDGNVKLRRMWEPTIVFAWIILQSIFSLLCFQGNIRIHLLVILSLICLLALLITALCWKILDEKERGTYHLSKILLPIIVICVLFAGAGIYAAWSEGRNDDRLIPDLSDLHGDVEDSQQKIDEYLASDPFSIEDSTMIDLEEFQEKFEQITDVPKKDDQNIRTSGMSGEELVQQICMDFYPADVYYKLMEEENVYIVAWSDDSEDIVIYQIAQQEDGYAIVTAFISSALTKEDVKGKEDGVWHME